MPIYDELMNRAGSLASVLQKQKEQADTIQAAKEQQLAKQKAEKEAALAKQEADKKLITHKSNVDMAANNEAMRKLLGVYGYKEGNIPAGTDLSMPGGGSIKTPDPASSTLPKLTPAQQAAEKEAGKSLGEFELGGREVAEENIKKLEGISDEISKERDWYDRKVGGLFQNYPSIQGIIAPDEHARVVNTQNTIGNLLKSLGDPNPTEARIKLVMAGVYDPSASTEENRTKIASFLRKQKGTIEAKNKLLKNYKSTGYATLGTGGQPQTESSHNQQTPPSTAELMKKLQEMEARRAKAGVK